MVRPRRRYQQPDQPPYWRNSFIQRTDEEDWQDREDELVSSFRMRGGGLRRMDASRERNITLAAMTFRDQLNALSQTYQQIQNAALGGLPMPPTEWLAFVEQMGETLQHLGMYNRTLVRTARRNIQSPEMWGQPRR